jgi:hypothetical protein
MVEAVTGIPRATIYQWKGMPWWQELVDQIQTESNQELDTKLSRIIDRSLDAVNERIEGGEFILDSKTGTVKRVPVKLKDVHRVAVDLLDKRDLLRTKPQERVEQAAAVDILKRLAGQFADWAKVHIKEPRIVEGVTLAVHEERETGLQDRVQQVPQPEEANQESKQPESGAGIV